MPYERSNVSGFLAGDETFDLMVAYMCLHDMDRMPEAIAEAGRVLEHGGRLCLAIASTGRSRPTAAPEAAGLLTEAIREPNAPARVVADNPGQRR
jgi:ubiquinone/menaquinone biosynthesis C-methylase UbiE